MHSGTVLEKRDKEGEIPVREMQIRQASIQSTSGHEES